MVLQEKAVQTDPWTMLWDHVLSSAEYLKFLFIRELPIPSLQRKIHPPKNASSR